MFSEFDPNHRFVSEDLAPTSLDNLKRDRFELLSAYLDGEVTPQERRQVESWLRADESMQCLYTRLLQLRRQMQTMPIPPASVSPDDVAQAVCQRLERRSRRPYVLGGAAIAALFCVFFSSTVPIPQQATKTSEDSVAERFPENSLALSLNEPMMPLEMASQDSLALSLHQPIIEIPQVEADADIDANP